MTFFIRFFIRLASLMVLLWLSLGCSKSADVEIHQPGEYKGNPDPLVKALEKPELKEELQARLKMVQTDR